MSHVVTQLLVFTYVDVWIYEYTGLLTNFFSFTSYTYKIGLVYCLIDRAYKINNTTFGFNQDMSKVKDVLNRNMFPSHLVENKRKILGTGGWREQHIF